MDNTTKYGVWALVILVTLYLLWQYVQYENCVNHYMRLAGFSRDLARVACK